MKQGTLTPQETACCAMICGKACCCPDEKCDPTNTFCCPKRNRNTLGSISAIRSGPPTQADVTIQNTVEGISSISLTKVVNCTVAGLPKTFSPPTTSPILLTATKIDQTKIAQFEFSVCTPDTCCVDVDPIFTVLQLSTGQWVRQTFADIPAAEHFLTVTNGSPGLKGLHIWINSRHAATLRLRDNETQNLDLAPVMTEQVNTISLVGAGELGASASVLIGDIPLAAAAKKGGMGATAAAPAQGSSRRHNSIWGPLAEATEENSHLHAAKAASQTVQVNFNGALSSGAASPSAFTVEVNGKAAAVQTAHLQSGAAGMDVTLQLPQGTLHNGDSVDIYWENLRDAKGRPLSGHVPLFAH